MPQAPCLTPSPAVLPTAGSAVSTTISTMPPGPPRYCPAPPEPGRNSWVLKNSGKRTSVTSRLPNLMPPAACHSPPPGQPSPATEAPPPGRAWIGPHHRARLGDDLDRTKGAVVFWGVRVDQIGQRDDDRGIHVRVGRVDEARDLGLRVGEVDLQIAAGFGDRGADMDVVVAAPIIVEQRLAVID